MGNPLTDWLREELKIDELENEILKAQDASTVNAEVLKYHRAAIDEIDARVAALEDAPHRHPEPSTDIDPPANEEPLPDAAGIEALIARAWREWVEDGGTARELSVPARYAWIAHYNEWGNGRLITEIIEDMQRVGQIDGWLMRASPESPAPAPVPSIPGATNADRMIDDMTRTVPPGTLKNVPTKYGWSTRGMTYQGANPDFSIVPDWASTARSQGVGRFMLPWFVWFETNRHPEHQSDTPEHLGMAGLALLFFVDGKWHVYHKLTDKPSGSLHDQGSNYFGGDDRPTWSVGDNNVPTLSMRGGRNFHGYSTRIALPSRFEAVQVQHAIEYHGPADWWAAHVSGDYYRNKDGDPGVIVPGFAISAPKLLKPGRNVLFATSLIDTIDPTMRPGARGITAQQLRDNPPAIVV